MQQLSHLMCVIESHTKSVLFVPSFVSFFARSVEPSA
jgi:hypothetical protein